MLLRPGYGRTRPILRRNVMKLRCKAFQRAAAALDESGTADAPAFAQHTLKLRAALIESKLQSREGFDKICL